MTMMPTSSRSPAITSLSLRSRMKACAAGRRSSTLSRSCEKMTGGCASRAVLEARRAGNAVDAGKAGAEIGLGLELAGDMTGADAQLHHHGRMARLRELEAFLDHAHDGGKVGARIEQPHRRLHRIGVGALLDHARALAVILAQDDHHAADDAGRGEVRERVGRDVGADDRFPGHRAAQRVVDGGAEHGGGGGLVGAGLEMHAEVADDVLGVDQDVEQVRHRRALVAADIAHPRLQQGLGHCEDAFAVEGLAVAELERLHLFLEGAFHRLSCARRTYIYNGSKANATGRRRARRPAGARAPMASDHAAVLNQRAQERGWSASSRLKLMDFDIAARNGVCAAAFRITRRAGHRLRSVTFNTRQERVSE